MIPQTLSSVRVEEMPSLTYRISADGDSIHGTVDGLEAVRQSVMLRLRTERGIYPIYGNGYGSDLHELLGKPIGYVLPELERRVKETVIADERVVSVILENIEVNAGGVIMAKFTARTIYGDFESEVIVHV